MVGFPLFFVILQAVLTKFRKINSKIMEYSVTHFIIIIKEPELMQPCRELLADMMAEVGYETFVDTEEGLDAYIQTPEYNPFNIQESLESFPIEAAEITFQTEDMPSEDWNAEWEKEGFEPIRVMNADGNTCECIIYDAKSDTANEMCREATTAVAIDPKMAFGTGGHETTQMIVQALTTIDLQGKRVLDCGCGTGILGIVALKRGAEHVTAYDIDEWSVENTRHNAAINGITDSMEDADGETDTTSAEGNAPSLSVMLGNVGVLSHVDGVFDVVLANINRNILLADMEHFRSAMAPDGLLILSGFYIDDAQLLVEKATELGLHETGRSIINKLTMLAFRG